MTAAVPAAFTPDLGIASLRARYRAGSLTPGEVARTVVERIEKRGADGVWISRVDPDRLVAAADALDPASLEDRPLFGVPFAVKDNVDVVGLPTTAAYPGREAPASSSAPVVEALVRAGAILVGKTNLDQFATGLSGTRSPYGIPRSVHDHALISGGSSSGSGVAVGAGLVSFALGTDTAGSGRVPAALNGVVGVKPSIGLVSTRGVVPACRSLDCVTAFAADVADGAAVLAVIAGHDDADPWSRALPVPPATPSTVSAAGLRLAVPRSVERWGARGERAAWQRLLDRLSDAGVELVPVDLTPFLEAGRQLYDGAWIAERLDGLEELVVRHRESLHPVVREILARGLEVRGVDVFAAIDTMADLRREARRRIAHTDALLTPTVTETFTVEEMRRDPIALNARLGTYTTFSNLLDLCALALPAGGRADAPFGVTIHAPAGRDPLVAGIGATVEAVVRGAAVHPGPSEPEGLRLAVVGAHLRGMPLHDDLLARGAVLEARTTTAPAYRLFRLAHAEPAKPGLLRVGDRGGVPIEVEVYRLPLAEVGGLLRAVRAPLAIGQVTLADGAAVHGFVCEPEGLDGAEDITEFRGWRAFVESTASAP